MSDLFQRLAANDLVERAVHSAWQAAALVVMADTSHLASIALWKAAVAAAGGAALSALKTYLVAQRAA